MPIGSIKLYLLYRYFVGIVLLVVKTVWMVLKYSQLHHEPYTIPFPDVKENALAVKNKWILDSSPTTKGNRNGQSIHDSMQLIHKHLQVLRNNYNVKV